MQDVGIPRKKKEHTNMKQLFITEVDYQQTSGCSRGNIDNIRRILSSFFGVAGGRKAEYCGRYPRLMI